MIGEAFVETMINLLDGQDVNMKMNVVVELLARLTYKYGVAPPAVMFHLGEKFGMHMNIQHLPGPKGSDTIQ